VEREQHQIHRRRKRNVKQLHGVRVGPPPKFTPVEGSEFTQDVDLVLLAMGFLGPVRSGLLEQLGVALDGRSNVAANDYQTSVENIFAAGDMRRGQSLVVWAISEGRKAAAAVDRYLAAVDEPAPQRHRVMA
jgi:glutamate synthase (NADPH/NADH) small chain